jgi:hypothetical protein
MSGNGVSSGRPIASNATGPECWQARHTGQTPVKPLAFIAPMVGAWVGMFAGMGAPSSSSKRRAEDQLQFIASFPEFRPFASPLLPRPN